MRLRSFSAALVAAAATVAATTSAVYADVVKNSLDSSVDAVAEIMPLNVGGPAGTTDLSIVERNDDGKQGCNLTGQTTLVIAVASSQPSVATVSLSSATFTSCGDIKTISVTPLSAGSTTVTVTQVSNTTAGTFDFDPATFTVNVSAAAPANTAPKIEITGAEQGASYPKGAVPNAQCIVTDIEDGNSSFPATLSAVVGPYVSDGLGEQTASCSYTDGGGLTASSSVRYSIDDPTPPAINYTLDPALPNGANGWYVTNVSLTWHVTEAESPNSLTVNGCVDQTITSDQLAMSSCAASSAGGSTDPVTATVKRDSSAPSGRLELTSGGSPYEPGKWTNKDVFVHYASCDDNGPSGLVDGSACPTDQTISAEGTTVIPDVTLTDNAGNFAVIPGAVIKIDRTDPRPQVVPERTTDHGDWYNHAFGYRVSDAAADGLSAVTCDPAGSYDGPDSATASVSATCTDEAGNLGTGSFLFSYDATGPALSPSVSPSPVVLNASATASAGATDGTSWIEISSCDAVDTSIVGPDHTAACSATNGAGLSTAASAHYSVVYAAGGTCLGAPSRQVLQPVNPDGSSVFKQGSTVPVKFRVCDANGVSVGTAGVVTSFSLKSKSSGTPSTTLEDVVSTTPDTTFRWDATAQQWIFNLSTKNLSKGYTYGYEISLNDGTSIPFQFALK